jgi:SAM-dependent methyltransferase
VNYIKEETLGQQDETYHRYLLVCEQASNDDATFQNFKSNANYTYELEHTSVQLGEHYVSLLLEEYHDTLKDLDWDKIKRNDMYGNTGKYNFSRLSDYCGDGCEFSPTTIGYLYLSLRMLRNLKIKNQNNIDVFEIGCGYGGQCYLFYTIAEFMGVTINSYNLVDLYHATTLQEKYLSSLGITETVNFLPCKDFDKWKTKIKNVDYVISNYAFSEMSDSWAKRYLDIIISKAKHGFFQWNNNDGKDGSNRSGNFSLSEFVNDIPDNHSMIQDPGNPLHLYPQWDYMKLIEF